MRKTRWLVSSLYMRMSSGVLSTTVTYDLLKNKVLPPALLTYELVQAIPPKMPFPGPTGGGEAKSMDTVWTECTSAQPLWIGHAKTQSGDQSIGSMVELKPSSKMAVKLMEKLHSGEEENLLREMSENCGGMTTDQKFQYEKLKDFLPALIKQWEIDTSCPKQSCPAQDAEPPAAGALRMVQEELAERQRSLAMSQQQQDPAVAKEKAIEEYYDKRTTAHPGL